MIKYLTLALVLLVVATSNAQAVRGDTTTLGIYNTGARFLLTRADFGTQTPTDILADMVIAYDTVQIATIVTDTGRSSRVRQSYEKRCNSIAGLSRNSELFKDKIVLMELNKDCDVTQLCLLAQQSGAKAFVFIHNSNSNGNIHLPKKGLYPESINMPVFVVGNEHGKNISALLPSKAGIRTKVPQIQNLIVNNTNNPDALNQQVGIKGIEATEGSSLQDEQTGLNADVLGKGRKGFSLSPNPSRNETNLTYQFPKATDMTIEVKTTSGQVVLSQILRGATVGNLNIQTTDWASGTYFISLQYGKEIKTKKFVVQH
jgi:hypothetical protein